MNQTWWIPDQKQYRPETERWYCGTCDKRTKIERNPAWNGSLSGEAECPDWFVRCAVCKHAHYQTTEGACPNCGRYHDPIEDPENLGTWIRSSPVHRYTHHEWGEAAEWTEAHRCRSCRTVFSFSNGYP